MSSRLLNLTALGGTPQPLGSHALFQALIASLLTYLWLRRETFTATPMFLRICGTGPSRVITRRYVLSFKRRLIEDNSANAFHDDHRYSADPFGALAEFKTVLAKAKKQTVHELSRKTPDSVGAKLFIASTALRACGNIHLGTLMRCCEAWKAVGNCFEPISLECINFQKLSQIIENLTRQNLAERDAEITNLPWTQSEKDNALARCRIGHRAKNLCFVPMLSLIKTVVPEKKKMNQEEGLVSIVVPFSKPASRTRGITSTKISCSMFRKLLTHPLDH